MSDTLSQTLSAARSALSEANKKFPSPATEVSHPAATMAAPEKKPMTQGEEISKSLEAKKKNISDYTNQYGSMPYSAARK